MKELKLIKYKSKRPKVADKTLVFDLDDLNYEDASFLISNIGPAWDDILVDGSRWGAYGPLVEKLREEVYDKYIELGFLKRFNNLATSDDLKHVLLELHMRIHKLEIKNENLQSSLDDLLETFRGV
jgi:hypothetical protein